MVMRFNATFNDIYLGTKAIGSPDTYTWPVTFLMWHRHFNNRWRC